MCLLISQFEHADPKYRSHNVPSRLKTDRLYEVREMLMLSYAQPLVLTQIAKTAGLSKTALTTGFRQLFGMSVYDFIQQQRMFKAMQLLNTSERSIARVAEEVGYKQACNFSTAFRSYFGCSPNTISNS